MTAPPPTTPTRKAKAKASVPPVTAHRIHELLALRFQAPEWTIEREVTLAGRRLDALAFRVWGGGIGRQLLGIEVKVSRGDWLRERAKFEKAWPAVVACDQMILVAPRGVVQLDELPAGWGLMELRASRLVMASYGTSPSAGHDMPRELAARLLHRRIEEAVRLRHGHEHKLRAEVRTEIEARVRREHDQQMQDERAELATLRTQMDQLYRLLGMQPNEWGAHQHALRAAAAYAQYGREATGIRRRLAHIVEESEKHAEIARRALADLPEPPVVP